MKAFISHSSKDKAFVRKLADALRSHGISPWVDTGEVKPGESLVRKLEEGLSNSDLLLVVLSPDALESGWVRQEVDAALVNEAAGTAIRVIPLLYRDCEIPPFLRSKVWIDFRGIDSDSQRFDEAIGVVAGHITKAPQREPTPGLARIVAKTRSTFRLTLVTHRGEQYDVEVPADAMVESVKHELVKELRLPRKFDDGSEVYYQLLDKSQGKVLSSHLTLRQNEVQDGSILILSPQLLAG